MSTLKRTARIAAAVLSCSLAFPAMSSADTLDPVGGSGYKATTQQSHPDSLQGSDGKARTISDYHKDGLQGREIGLLDGDALKVSDDGKTASIINADGVEVGSFSDPSVQNNSGEDEVGSFIVRENVLTVVSDTPQFRDGCGKATVGKWTYRIGAAGVCGALAAGTGGIAGGACGLGASAAEDHINFDRVC